MAGPDLTVLPSSSSDMLQTLKLCKQQAAITHQGGGEKEEAGAGAAAADPEPTIDLAFVVPPEYRSSRPFDSSCLIPSDHVPVVDLGALNKEDSNAFSTVVSQVGQACEEWGFFQIINHEVSQTLIQNLRDAARAFFELPLQKKLEVKRSYGNPLGYNDGELTKNVRDWKEVFDIAPGGSYELPKEFDGDDSHTVVHPNQWPSYAPSLRRACEEYLSAVETLAFTLLELIARSLGLSPDRFHDLFRLSGTSLFRLNHYPVCPAPELALGISRHKDSGALTILLQDEVGGLEVRKSNGEWVGVKPDPKAFVVNVGDIIQVFSNDRYKSVEHRVVVNKNTDRYSFPFFFNPAHWVSVQPLPELTNHDRPPKYKPFNWGKYFKRRNDSNYKDLGVENLQIYHFAMDAPVDCPL